MKYNKDMSFIESIEKFGIEKNINKDIYKEMIMKYDNDKEKINKHNKIKNNKDMNYTYDNNDSYYIEVNNNNINKDKNNIFIISKRNRKNSNKIIRKKLNKNEFEE